jgi:CRP-like cAMP-binding protein
MAQTQSKLWHLERINLFKDLTEEDLSKIEKVARMRTMEKGKYIYFPNDPSTVVFLLKEGNVKIGSYSDEGKEVIKTILEPGEIFGELSIAGQEKRTDFAKAMNNARICAVSKEEMLQILNDIPSLSLKITNLIGLRLQRIERRFESLVFKDARKRVTDFIKTSALEKGKKVGYEYVFKHRLTHKDIANLTATSRQTVTIVLNELRDKKVISFDRNRILIHEMDQL